MKLLFISQLWLNVMAGEDLNLDEVDINADIDSVKLSEGDIRGPTRYHGIKIGQGRSTLRSHFFRWPYDVNYVPIPFEMEEHMPPISRGISQDAKTNYALRTCIDLKPWEGEEQYIRIFQGGGCYSYLGWSYYSQQALSIGSRCNSQVGTFQHEFMHALGIFHEQSRPDRDTYVFVNLTDVKPGTEGNFNKYDFGQVSIADVPYDYESVMHYSGTGFVQTPGGTSIDPYIPYFANVIGQRKDFSRNDVAKINRMYQCSGPLLNSFSCDFTELNIGGFVNQPIDDPALAVEENRINWKQYDIKRKSVVGDTTANILDKTDGVLRVDQLVFPATDHSDGRDLHGRYMVLNGSEYADVDNSGRTGVIESRQFQTMVADQCLEIWTSIMSAGYNSHVEVEIWESDDRYGDIIGRFPIQSFRIYAKEFRNGEWNMNRWTVNAPNRFKLIIRSTLGSNNDVVVIDDISILDRPCESHSWPVHNFAEIYKSTPFGQFIQSEIMTASTGHKFVLRFYPRGHPTRSDETYASLFLHLHKDSNDIQELVWPWDKQFLKFIAQDQVPDVLYRMDQNRIRATEYQNGSDSWMPVKDADDMGVSETDSVIGYETFLPTFDIFESSYSYVKHDTMILLLDLRDLSNLGNSSKLSSCDGDGTIEEGRCPGEGRACMKVNNAYECACHYPFVENNPGNCTCPEGYEYNPDAEEQEAERLTCFSACDFIETNPCEDPTTCVQTSAGPICETKERADVSYRARIPNVRNGETITTKTFSPFELGISIALTAIGLSFVIFIVYFFFYYKRKQSYRQISTPMHYIQRFPPEGRINKCYMDFEEKF